MKEQYLKANVFVSASSIENSPNSVLEAMAVGAPVVSSFVAFTETESLTEAYGKEKKSISSSGFFSSMKTISEGFDEALFRMVKKYGSSFQEYRAETVVGEEEDGEGKALFLKKWIKAIV